MKMRRQFSIALLAAKLVIPMVVSPGMLAEAQSSIAPIHYTVTLANPAEHLLRVEISIPPGAVRREFQLPVWNATYQVRDFSEYVRWLRVRAADGTSLTPLKLNKSLWRGDRMGGGGVGPHVGLANHPGRGRGPASPAHAVFL